MKFWNLLRKQSSLLSYDFYKDKYCDIMVEKLSVLSWSILSTHFATSATVTATRNYLSNVRLIFSR